MLRFPPIVCASRGEGLALRHRRCREALGGHARDEIRIGAERAPHRALRGQRDAGEVGAEAQDIGDELEVQMRRPSAVHCGRTERRDLVARAHRASDLEIIERLPAQVSVQREELRAVLRLVAEHDHGAVVERLPVVGEGVDHSVQRRVHRRAHAREQIEPDVDRAMLGERPAGTSELRRSVNQPRLIVAADRRAARPSVSSRRTRAS